MIRVLALLLLSLPAWSGTVLAEQILRVAVAANFRATLERINQDYSAAEIILSSASTGVLATQIRHGAPFDLFFSADQHSASELERDGLGSKRSCYALGQLVLVGGELEDLADPGKSLAIANPQTAPYGRAASEVLAREALAAASGRQPVRGASVLQAYQFWRAGAVDLALVARSQAPGASAIPAHWHSPIEQELLLLRPSPAANAYLEWLGSDTVRQMIANAGYRPCP